jgi:hypothetical protein
MKVLTVEKEETPNVMPFTPSFYRCLDQVWHILCANILLKKEEISLSDENFELW